MQFISQWVGLNLLGCAIGLGLIMALIYVVAALQATEFFWKMILPTLLGAVLGTSLGLCQWLLLKKLGLKALVWISWTALGCGLAFSVLAYFSYELPPVGLSIVGGALASVFQSILIRKYISRPICWAGAHIFGLFVSLAGFLFIISHGSPIKRFLLSVLPSDLFWLIYTERAQLAEWGALLMAVLIISMFTGAFLLSAAVSGPAPEART
jgi:hypothetical protein